MRWSVATLLCCSVALGQGSPKPALLLPKALASVLAEAKAKSHVAIPLPSELPQPFAEAKDAVIQSDSEDEYAISLYYEASGGGILFAASFSANGRPDYGPKNIPNVRKVKLTHGLVGLFP